MDYASTLQFLQGLLSQNQATNASQFQQGMGYDTSKLNEQGREYDLGNTLQTAQLGETGREFDASTALQKVIADWQNQLATNQLAMQQQNQNYNQNYQTTAYNDSRNGMTAAQLNNAAFLANLQPNQSYTDWQNRMSAQDNAPNYSLAPINTGAALMPFNSPYNVIPSGGLSLGVKTVSPSTGNVTTPNKVSK
jgi:hypothetical protein